MFDTLKQEPSINPFQSQLTYYQLNKASLLYKKGYTNHVFRVQRNNKIIYHLPAYIRLKIKNIVSIDLFTLSGQVNSTFILSVFYAEMQPQVIQFLSKSIELAFHKSQALVLNEQNLEVDRKINEKKSLITFTIRKVISARLEGQIFWSPFQTVKFLISISLRTLKTRLNGKWYMFKFNLMDCDDIDTKFSLAEEGGFGMFKIAQKQLEVQYSNQFAYSKSASVQHSRKVRSRSNPSALSLVSIPPDTKKQIDAIEQQHQPLSMRTSINNFQYAHFILPVYKKPNPALLTIYFPTILLGIINIGIFFQDNKRTGKQMLNIASLLVSFVALVPTIRQNTAISPTVTFTQILVFIESFTTILTLIHMINNRNADQYVQILQQDGLAIACIVITSLIALFVVVMILLHKFYWKRQYHRSKVQKKGFKFDHTKWYNKQCDEYYIAEVNGIQDALVPWVDPDEQKNNKMKYSTQKPIQGNKRQQTLVQSQLSAQKIKIRKFQSM